MRYLFHTHNRFVSVFSSSQEKYAKIPLTIDTHKTQPLASYKRNIRSRRDDAWKREWEPESIAGAVKEYRKLGLKLTTKAKSMPELTLYREVFRWSIAARSGHSHFADIDERFGHDEQDLHCECGRWRWQLHLFFCQNATQHRNPENNFKSQYTCSTELI